MCSSDLSDYNPSAAIAAARDFFWNELCDWYLELIKPRFRPEVPPAARAAAQQVLATVLDQVRQQRARNEELSFEIDIDDFFPGLWCVLHEWFHAIPSRIIDQNVNPAELMNGLLDCVLSLGVFREIGFDGCSTTACGTQLGGHGLRILPAQIQHSDARKALPGQLQSDSPADAAPASGYNRIPSFCW